MSKLRHVLCAALAALLMVAVGNASAEPASASADATSPAGKAEAAAKLFDDATARAKKKDWAGAYELLKRSFELQPSSETATNLGQSAYKLGKIAEASRYVAYGLRTLSPTVTPAARRGIDKMFSAMKKEVTQVVLSVEPIHAEVFVNGESRGRASELVDPVFLDPGTHRIEARADGYVTAAESVTATAGKSEALSLELKPEQTAAAVGSGLGGSGSGAPEPAPGGAPSDGGTSPKDDAGVPARTVVLVGGAALTLVSAAVAVGFMAKANGHQSDADGLLADAESQFGAASPCVSAGRDSAVCTGLASANESRADANKVEGMAWIATGVFGVATAATFFLWSPGPDKRASGSRGLSLAPVVSPEGATAVLHGHF